MHTITIKGIGKATTTFEGAAFKVSVTHRDETGPKAKNAAKGTMAEVLSVLDQFKEVVSHDDLRTSFEVKPYDRHDGNRYVHGGYEAVWTCVFTCQDVTQATAIHDALTSIKGVVAATPVFIVEQKTAEMEAFKLAFEDARERFVAQCQVVGHNPKNYRLISWDIEREHSRGGKHMALTESDDGGVKLLSTGKAMFTVNLNLVYGLPFMLAMTGK